MIKIRMILIASLFTVLQTVSAVSAESVYQFEIADALTYSEKSEYWSLDISVPEIRGMADETVQQDLNTYFLSKADDMIREYRQNTVHAAESIAEGNSPNFSYQYRYDVVTDSDEFFVLRTACFYRSSSATETSEYWTLDKATGRLLNFDDVLQTPSEFSNIREQILIDMLKFNHDAGAAVYWTQGTALIDALAQVGEKHHWYFNENGDLVIAFDKFEIGPAIVGSPEFTIDHSASFVK